MAYIIGIIVVALFFIALHFLTDLNKVQKLVVAGVLLAIISGAITFNAYGDRERENMLNVVLKYNQNKTVHCGAIEVNSTNYSLSIGTYTFIGKENTPNFNQMISVIECQ